MEGEDSVILATSALPEDGPCVWWTSIRCHAAGGPTSGDLVIILPDDDASLADVSVYRGKPLFYYEPHPSIPDRLHEFFASFHIATTRYRSKVVPDRWMDGSLTVWK